MVLRLESCLIWLLFEMSQRFNSDTIHYGTLLLAFLSPGYLPESPVNKPGRCRPLTDAHALQNCSVRNKHKLVLCNTTRIWNTQKENSLAFSWTAVPEDWLDLKSKCLLRPVWTSTRELTGTLAKPQIIDNIVTGTWSKFITRQVLQTHNSQRWEYHQNQGAFHLHFPSRAASESLNQIHG